MMVMIEQCLKAQTRNDSRGFWERLGENVNPIPITIKGLFKPLINGKRSMGMRTIIQYVYGRLTLGNHCLSLIVADMKCPSRTKPTSHR